MSTKRGIFNVVEFKMKNGKKSVCVIPQDWITDECHCVWPPYTKQSKIDDAVKSQKKPEIVWQVYEMRILGSADTFEKADNKLSKALYTSDLQSESESVKQASVRKERQPNGGYPTPPAPTSSPQTLNQKNSESEEIFSTGSPKTPATRSRSRSREQRRADCTPATMRLSNSVSVRGEEYIVTKLSLLESKIDCLVTMLSRVAPDISTDIPELPDDVDLPINSMANLITIEENLNGDDRSLKNSMIAYLGIVGGKSEDDTIERVLSATIGNSLARSFNWNGLRGKTSFKNLEISKIIYAAVRRNPLAKKTSLKTFQQTTAKWLYGSRDREGGHKERNVRRQTSLPENNDQAHESD